MKYSSTEHNCCVTGAPGSDLHHVKTRGSGGKDEAWNLIPLSRALHTEVHKIGMAKMANKYLAIRNWLVCNGWYWDDFLKRWHHHK